MATTERDLYQVLGVERGATDADIKRAFRKLAQQWHPDVNTDPEAPARFKEASEAYQILSDPDRRQRYDMFGRAGVDGGAGGPGAGFEGFGGFSDIFDAFFGGAAGGGSARRGRPQPGADLRYDLRITFEEAIHGVEREIDFRVLVRCETCSGTGAKPGTEPITCPQCEGRGEVRTVRQTMLGQMVNVSACPRCRGEGKIVETPCETCKGDGRTERKRSLRVTIPAGIDEGHQIRLTNEGEVGPRGGPPGSLYVAVHVAPHPTLKRDGTELYYEAHISIAQAALGTKLAVPTVDVTCCWRHQRHGRRTYGPTSARSSVVPPRSNRSPHCLRRVGWSRWWDRAGSARPGWRRRSRDVRTTPGRTAPGCWSSMISGATA